MKVKELIEELQKLDGENECVIFDDTYNGEYFRFLPITTIEEIKSDNDEKLIVIGCEFDLDEGESGEGEDLSHLN